MTPERIAELREAYCYCCTSFQSHYDVHEALDEIERLQKAQEEDAECLVYLRNSIRWSNEENTRITKLLKLLNSTKEIQAALDSCEES